MAERPYILVLTDRREIVQYHVVGDISTAVGYLHSPCENDGSKKDLADKINHSKDDIPNWVFWGVMHHTL